MQKPIYSKWMAGAALSLMVSVSGAQAQTYAPPATPGVDLPPNYRPSGQPQPLQYPPSAPSISTQGDPYYAPPPAPPAMRPSHVPAPAMAPAPAPAMGEVQTTATGVKYFSGGVGEQGRAEIENMQADYSLKLMFAATQGMFLANVAVLIHDSKGNLMLETVTDGPVLLVDLPTGSYKVTAREEETKQTKTASVSARAGRMNTQYVRFNIPSQSE